MSKLGDVILDVPPGLEATESTTIGGRVVSISVNPGGVLGTPQSTPSFNPSGGTLLGIVNEGGGTGLIFDTIRSGVATLRSLNASTVSGLEGITITTTGATVVIGNSMTGINLGGGAGTRGLFAGKTVSGALDFYNITPGANISFSTGGDGDIIISSTGASATFINEGTGVAVFDQFSGGDAYFRTLVADTTVGNEGIVLGTSGPFPHTVVTIGTSVTGANVGTVVGDQGLFIGKLTNGTLQFKSLAQGANITLTSTSTDVVISATGSLTPIVLMNEGTGAGQVYDQTVSNVAYFRTLQIDPTAGNEGIAIATVGSYPGDAVVNIGNTMTGGNVGAGAGVFNAKTGAGVLTFNSFVAGANISVTPSSDEITIAVTGVFIQGGNAFGTTAILGTTDNNPLTVITDSILALTISNVNQAATFTGSLTALGSLALNGTSSGKFTQNAAAATTSYAVTWPAMQGSLNSVLTNNSSGGLSWSTNPGNFFQQGGNTFGATAVLGTMDNNPLQVITDNVVALTYRWGK